MSYKSRKTWLIIILVLLVIIVAVLSVNGKNKDDKYTYENGKYGFKLELPIEWKDKVLISDGDYDDSVLFFVIKIDGSQGGHLFSINRETGELITEEDVKQSPIPSKLLMHANGYTYYATFPSDVQYDPEKKDEMENYNSMNSKVEGVLKSIKPYGDERSAASNEGYKVVGNSFFTLEVPEDLEMESGDGLFWNLTEEGNAVGSLIMSQGQLDDEDKNVSSNTAYITRPDSTIYTCISVNEGSVGETDFEVMKNTFRYKTVGTPVTVLDYIDTAEQYLELGGSRLFGKITDISPVSHDENDEGPLKGAVTTVALMEFVTDESQPDGYKIVDLNETKSFESGYGGYSPDVIPLVPPNYTTFGVYDRYLLDEEFFKDYGDESNASYYKNFYYDFILDPDGNLLLISGHYVP